MPSAMPHARMAATAHSPSTGGDDVVADLLEEDDDARRRVVVDRVLPDEPGPTLPCLGQHYLAQGPTLPHGAKPLLHNCIIL